MLYIYIYLYIHYIYPYAPCGAHTAAPDFVACGLLQLTSFGKLQNALDSFEVNVRYYKFSEVLCQFSADILH